jgi:hypothetical protein
MPLPSEDTTPPVTKTNLVMNAAVVTSLVQAVVEGRDRSLLTHPPLRTGLATFTASGSSTTGVREGSAGHFTAGRPCPLAPKPQSEAGFATVEPLACNCTWHTGCSNTRLDTASDPPATRDTR